jgi:hypothetical protein
VKILYALLPFLIIASLSASSLAAETCTGPEFKQFDFWIGSWNVKNSEGKEVGRNEISRASSGCALLEHWTGATGVTGVSISNYDSTDEKWHQHWIGSDGQPLDLIGGISGIAMILSQTHGNGRVDRVTWTPLADGRVKQEWESSTDDGKNWKTAFLGFYERR